MIDFLTTIRRISAAPRSQRLKRLGGGGSVVTTTASELVGATDYSADIAAMKRDIAALQNRCNALASAIGAVEADNDTALLRAAVLNFYGFGNTPTAAKPVVFSPADDRFFFAEGYEAIESYYQRVVARIGSGGRRQTLRYPRTDVLYQKDGDLYRYADGALTPYLTPTANGNLAVADFYGVFKGTCIPVNGSLGDTSGHRLCYCSHLGTFAMVPNAAVGSRPLAAVSVYLNWQGREAYTDDSFAPLGNVIFRTETEAYVYTGAALEKISDILSLEERLAITELTNE